MNSLIWLEQPVSQSQWIRRLISGTEDVGGTEFRVMRLPSTVTETELNVFIVAGRKSGKLTAYWVEGGSTIYCQPFTGAWVTVWEGMGEGSTKSQNILS